MILSRRPRAPQRNETIDARIGPDFATLAFGRDRLQPVLCVRLAAERPELRIVADQVGAPTPAGVIADGIARMLSEDAAALPKHFAAAGGLVHLATAGATSWHGFAVASKD
jgi:dTDP-4-dehydrorhamnose reductase